MKLLIDHQIFSSFRRSGISRYFCELAREFPALGVDWSCSAAFTNNEFLRELRPNLPTFFPNLNIRGKNRVLERINLFFTHRALNHGDFDVFHSTYSKPYDRETLRGKPYVITVHDLTHEKFPDMPCAARETREEAQSIANADAVVVPSYATRADLLSFYPEAAAKIRVIPHGVRLPDNFAQLPRRFPAPYVIYVGTREHHKNFPVAARALSLIPDLTLVCCGSDFSAAEKRLFTDLGIASRVRHFYGDNTELFSIYRHAEALLFPSIAEGFGLPAAEAIAAGCVPILSDIPVFREVGGDAACYFAPDSAEECAEWVRAVLNDPILRREKLLKAVEQAKIFDWKRSASQHATLYRELI